MKNSALGWQAVAFPGPKTAPVRGNGCIRSVPSVLHQRRLAGVSSSPLAAARAVLKSVYVLPERSDGHESAFPDDSVG
jgi:hypothetical protein